MEIKTTSWHWKLIDNQLNFYVGRINNSCDYFWLLIKAIAKTFVQVIGLLVVLAVLVPATVLISSLVVVSILLWIPELIYLGTTGESLYAIVVTLANGKWLWLVFSYETMATFGTLGYMLLSIPLSLKIIELTKATSRSVRGKITLPAMPVPLHDVRDIFKAKFVDKICLPVDIVTEDGYIVGTSRYRRQVY